MAAATASPSLAPSSLKASSSSPPSLPPLITTVNVPRRTSSQRHPSYASKRMSSYSNTSRASHQAHSRPESYVFPVFHSSLPYTLVRDFAYPINHPLHYGPPPNVSGISTPLSESRRLSDPAVASWEDSRSSWSTNPPWTSDSAPTSSTREQLPAMTFSDGGPPYSEDEDLQSPVVTTARHKKRKSSVHERGRSPGAAGPNRGVFVGTNGDGSQQFYRDETGNNADANGPGGEIYTQPADAQRPLHSLYHRDSNFAKPIHRAWSQQDEQPIYISGNEFSEPEDEEDEEDSDEMRFSKEYSFTIASPDEEMHGKAVALFDFESEHQNELPLREGQIILVSYRHGQGWLVAEDPKTGESGLVPEEFVRLVRDIEGGLNGLESVNIDASGDGGDAAIDATNDAGYRDPSLETTPTQRDHSLPTAAASSSAATSKHAAHSSNDSGGSGGGVHLPVQSSFSTSSKDLHPYPLRGRSLDESTPVLPDHDEKDLR